VIGQPGDTLRRLAELDGLDIAPHEIRVAVKDPIEDGQDQEGQSSGRENPADQCP
jgi:hypothetical protein